MYYGGRFITRKEARDKGAEPRQLSLSTSMARKLIAVESSSSVHDTRTRTSRCAVATECLPSARLLSLEGNEMVCRMQKENLVFVVTFSNQGILFN